jgi:hypothetical protein
MNNVLKSLVLMFGILILNSCGVSYQSGYVKTKDGTKKPFLMKQDNQYLLVKESSSDEPKKILYSEIDYVEKRNNLNDETKFKFFKVANQNKYVLVEEEIVGPVSLYISASSFNSNPMGPGMGMTQQTIVVHYVKRKHNDEVILLSSDYFSDQSLKMVGPKFFKDCPKLVEKIENRDFKKRHIYDIVRFYNENCGVDNT